MMINLGLTLASSYLVLISLMAFYRYFLSLWHGHKRFSLLSSIPGPHWAAWTRLWIVKALASGDAHHVFVDINKKYGAKVSIP